MANSVAGFFHNPMPRKPVVTNRDYVKQYNANVQKLTQKPAPVVRKVASPAAMPQARTPGQYFGQINKVQGMIKKR